MFRPAKLWRVANVRFPKPIRLEASAYSGRDSVFHVIVRALAHTKPFTGEHGDTAWKLLMQERARSSVVLVAACLMPDHMHVVVRPGDRPIPAWMGGFKSYSTRVLRDAGYPRRVWQPRYFDRLIRDEREYASALWYVEQNPVEAGLVERSSDWPWLLLPSE